MTVIIAGSRTIDSMAELEKAIADSGYTVGEVVSGGAGGVDRLGERWADANHVPKRIFWADWAKHGTAAGPIRNERMATYAASKGGALLLVWDGRSKGSRWMLAAASARKLKTYVHIVPTPGRPCPKCGHQAEPMRFEFTDREPSE
jgi:hypothetical protein